MQGQRLGVGEDGREAFSRFVFAMPLTRAAAACRPQYRREFLHRLASRLQAVVVVGLPHESVDKRGTLRDFSAFEELFSQHYRLTASFGFLDVFELRPEVRAETGR